MRTDTTFNKTLLCATLISSMGAIGAAQEDLILRTGRLIDGRGNVVENRDIAVLDGAIAGFFDRDTDTVFDYDLTELTVRSEDRTHTKQSSPPRLSRPHPLDCLTPSERSQ